MKHLFKENFPITMTGLVLTQFDHPMEIQTVNVPIPGKGQVLLKIDSAPINPSDWAFVRGLYSSPKKPPVIAGFEGSGIVMATGNDFLSRRLLGKKVACFAPPNGNGTWASYCLTHYTTAIPLRKDLNLEQGSMLLVNPLSVMAMIQISQQRKIKAIANTAAASALGQLLDKLCTTNGMACVNIVRRPEQVEQLKKNGATYVIDSSSAHFKMEMRDLFHQLNVQLAFDAVGGPMATDLLEALPKGAEVMSYGALSEAAMSVHPGKLIFENKKVSGFWLSQWITQQSMFNLLRSFKKIQRFLSVEHPINIQKRMSLAETIAFIQTYPDSMSAGKMLVKPWQE